MTDENRPISHEFADAISRRRLLQALGLAALGAPLGSAIAQGRCMRALGTPACDTMPVKPVFDPTGWRTVALDHITMRVADYEKEAAFYAALMGWTLRSDDGTQAVMDIGDFGSMVLRSAPELASIGADTAGGRGGAGGGGRGGRAPARAMVSSVAFGIAPWDAKKVEAALRARGLDPVADNRAGGYESFHIKDPDGFDIQLSNHSRRDERPSNARLAAPLPFAPTGWKTVWLDHLSFSVTNYKETASFYSNLLGWKPTYDEGSQNELLIGEVGDIIIRGGNPLSGAFSRTGAQGGGRGGAAPREARIDHISFGISPWDTDGVKAALEQRGLRAQVDTSTGDEIHVAAFKSYHTFTPNGYNLQISAVNHDTRLTLPNAVRPKAPG